MKYFSKLITILVIVGALNWGLVGAFNFDLVASLFGQMSIVSRIVYIIIGLSAVVKIVFLLNGCCDCKYSDKN